MVIECSWQAFGPDVAGMTIEQGSRQSVDEEVAAAYEAIREDVYRYLVLLGLAPAAAHDLTQETFLRLYKTRREGREIASTRAWIFTVAHNLGVNAIRSGDRDHPLPEGLEQSLVHSAPSPEEALLQDERRKRFNKAIAELSPQQRSCLHLRSEGFTYREIAGILGVSTPTVGEFLRRAVERLRKLCHE
jgi:RNA polymerase sigma-70 factor (ECF subfamily)